MILGRRAIKRHGELVAAAASRKEIRELPYIYNSSGRALCLITSSAAVQCARCWPLRCAPAATPRVRRARAPRTVCPVLAGAVLRARSPPSGPRATSSGPSRLCCVSRVFRLYFTFCTRGSSQLLYFSCIEYLSWRYGNRYASYMRVTRLLLNTRWHTHITCRDVRVEFEHNNGRRHGPTRAEPDAEA